MLVVGLTGGIASGKSTVSNLLSTRHNIPIIDADHLARVVVEPHTKSFHRIVTHFGPSVVAQTPSGPTLDRAALGARIFDNPAERAVLNSIVHPAVRKQMVWELMKCWARGERVVVVDVPLLIETGLWKWCGWVVVVYVNDACQLSRLLSRPPLNPSDPPLTPTLARSRISSQLPLTAKLPYADTVIDNSGPPSELGVQVDMMVRKWYDRTKNWWIVEWVCPPVGLWVGFWTVVWRRLKHGKRLARRGGGGVSRNSSSSSEGGGVVRKDKTDVKPRRRGRGRGRGENEWVGGKGEEDIEMKVM